MLALLLTALMLAALGGFALMLARGSEAVDAGGGACGWRYRRARTAADTAVVDALIIGNARSAPTSCGAERRLAARRSRP
jgi:hypothetical protein